MIKIKSIHIEEFRGIRDLTLSFDSKSFGICGPNGTGKSGVVDAIEFCLTGNITRLSGEGQGELSLKGHAPHVDQRDNPEKSKVTIIALIPAIGKDVAIIRSVKDHRAVQLVPEDNAVRSIVEELQAHPEFALSRREIAKYIVTPPAKRSTDVQNLLRLDHVGSLRSSFTAYANKCRRDAAEATRGKEQASSELKNALGLHNLNRDKVLEVVNRYRKILGLETITEISPDTSFKDGLNTEADDNFKGKVSKELTLAALAAVKDASKEAEDEFLSSRRNSAIEQLQKLHEDANALALARAHGFISNGLDLVTGDACPLCDTPWDAEELRAYLRAKLLSSQELGETLRELSESIETIKVAFERQAAQIESISSAAAKLDPPFPKEELDSHAAFLQGAVENLEAFLDNHTQVDGALDAVRVDWWDVSEQLSIRLEDMRKVVEALPDLSSKDKAIEFLAVAQDRYERLLEASKLAKRQSHRSAVAAKLNGQYNTVSNSVLEEIYDSVAEDFTEFYKAINDDEGQFTGVLKAEPAKLSFNVDFYGRGTFPPGAYHSEGHQDGMGLCLYLALMKRTLGEKFKFAVLDDVLMSVDTGHRREVCRLLKTEFPHTQFILTTHDRVWLQFMKTEGLIKSGQFFGGWNVETGPRIWDDKDIWAEISSALERNDVPQAAALLRRYLEYISAVLADNLRAQVEYRGDANYDLGDLLPPTLNRWRDRLDKAVKVADKWGHSDIKSTAAEMAQEAKSLIATSNAEQWAINKAVHFNEWQNLTASEFGKVADAFKALLENIRCSNEKCAGYPYLTPRKGSSEQLRCNCGAINLNLKLPS